MPHNNGPQLKGMFLPDGKRILISRGQFADMVAADLDGKTIATLPIRTGEFAVVAPGYLITASRKRCAGHRRAATQPELALTRRASGPARHRGPGVAEESIRFPHHQTASWHSCPAGGTARTSCTMPADMLRDTVRVDGTWTLSVRLAKGWLSATVAVAGNTVGIWLYDLDANRATRVLVQDSTFPTTGFAFGTTHPVFNSDGTHLAYAMRGANRCRIMDRDLVTGAERIVGSELATASSSIWAFSDCLFPDWSPDGRFLLTRSDTTLQIVAVDGSSRAKIYRVARASARRTLCSRRSCSRICVRRNGPSRSVRAGAAIWSAVANFSGRRSLARVDARRPPGDIPDSGRSRAVCRRHRLGRAIRHAANPLFGSDVAAFHV